MLRALHERKMIKLEEIEMREMMNLMEFIEYVKENIKGYLPDAFADATVQVSEVIKNNDQILYGMSILKPEQNISPTLYLEKWYEGYLRGKSLESILKEIAGIRIDADIPEKFDIRQIMDFENCKDKIYPRIINRNLNEKMLKNKPYKTLEDLAIIYFIKIGDLTDGAATMMINDELMKNWNITEDELHSVALQNEQNVQYSVRSMSSVLKSIGNDMSLGDIENVLNDIIPFFIVTNENGINGSAVLLNTDYLKMIESKIGKFYILPSSVHEIIVLPESEVNDAEYLKEMVKDVNDSVVEEDEILSYNVYQFTAKNGLEIAK